MSGELFGGLMSGTSMDGIDAVVVEFPPAGCRVLAAVHRPYSAPVRDLLERVVSAPADATLPVVAKLDAQIAAEFGAAALAVLAQLGAAREQVTAIGSHGQTVLHRPDDSPPFTMQLGDPGALAVHSGMTVVGDFRRGDLALGGQAAPLVPAFHRAVFGSHDAWRAVVNIGGIANISILSPGGDVSAFDTGPGNTLLDRWTFRHLGMSFDSGGSWAASGQAHTGLLAALLNDPYFRRSPPKSTGVDYFSLDWLTRNLAAFGSRIPAADVQATLAELTARTIAASLDDHPQIDSLAVAGGGARNDHLVRRLQQLLPRTSVATTAIWGIEPELVEASAFAWLARERIYGRASNLPEVTGARGRLSLGGIYLPPDRNICGLW